MAKKKNELEELKKRKDAMLSGGGLTAVKTASAASAADRKNTVQMSAGKAQQQKQAQANENIRAARGTTAQKAAVDVKTPQKTAVQQSTGRVQQQKQAQASANIRATRAAAAAAKKPAFATEPAIKVQPIKTQAEKTALERFGQEWQEARARGDQAGMDAAHAKAEALRGMRGYSGGADGSRNIRVGGQKSGQEAAIRAAFAALGMENGTYHSGVVDELEKVRRYRESRKNDGVLTDFMRRVAMTADASNINLNAGLMAKQQTDELAALERAVQKARAGEELSYFEKMTIKQAGGRNGQGALAYLYSTDGWENGLEAAEKLLGDKKATALHYGDGSNMAKAAAELNRRAREGAGKGTGVALDIVGTGADMLGRSALSMGNPYAYRTLSYIKTSGREAQEAIDNGTDVQKAQKLGRGLGAASAAIEGIGGVGASDIAGKAAGAVAGKAAPGVARFLAETPLGRITANAMSEGFEEFVEEPVSTGIKNKILGTEDKTDWKQAGYNAAIGALMGGLYGSVGEIGRGADARTDVQQQAQETQTIGRDERLAEARGARGTNPERAAQNTAQEADFPDGKNAVNPGALIRDTLGENEVRQDRKSNANQKDVKEAFRAQEAARTTEAEAAPQGKEEIEKPEAKGGAGNSFYRNIVSGQAEIEKFAREQKKANPKAANAEDLAQMSRSVGGTVDAIAGTALVDRKGDAIGKSWKETVGKLSKEESERLNLYRQHLHNIDRMSLEANAAEELAMVRDQIAIFKAGNDWVNQYTESELAGFAYNYDMSRPVREQAQEYLALLQKERELASVRNKPVLAKNNGKGEMIPYTAEESRNEVIAMLKEHPELEGQAKAAEKFHADMMREWAVGSGLMSEEQFTKLQEKYPHYVQSFRVDHVKTGPDGVTRKGGVNTSNPIRKAVGDISEIVPFEDAEMMQVNSIVRMARRNELFRNIYDFAKANPKDAAPYVRVLDAETDANTDVGMDIETMTEALEQGAMQATGDGYILMAMVDGKPVKMEVNADFYAGLQNLYGQDRGAVNDFLAGTIGKATTAFKQATTGYNVWFPITNFAKDIQTGYINTISDAPTFINYVGEIGGALADMKRGSDDWKAFRALGGRDSGYYHNEKGFTASDRMTRVESIKDVPRATWEKTKELLTFVGENGEAVMRFAEYKAGVKKYGNTQEGRAKAIQAAADVTVNFSRSAPVAKTFENFVPYLNASIQGLDKMYRQAKEHPVKTTRRNLEMLTATTLLLWMVNKDDEDYKNLNNRTKDNYFCIPVGRIAEGMGIDEKLRKYGIEVEGKFLKIPKSREWSAVFSAWFERYLRTIEKPKDASDDSAKAIIARLIGRDEAEGAEKAYRGIGTQFLTNVAPSNPVTDNILKTIFIDLPNNKDFAGRDIVPQRLQGLSPENQYDYTTSDVGKAVAKAWNAGADVVNRVPGIGVPKLAPVQADYLIDSNLGFVGDMMLAAGSDKSALSYFGDTFAQKFTADPRYQNGATDYFYEILDAAETAKNDANLAEGITSRMKTPEEFYYSELNSYKNEISELRKQEREILSGNMSKQEQEQRVREIRQQIIDIANEAPGKAQEALEAYKRTYIPEISHLSDEKQEAARRAHDELGLAYEDFVRFTDDYAEYEKEMKGKEKDAAADVAEMIGGYTNLTDEQRDALYQVYSDNMEKNPFHVSKYEAEMDQTTGLYSEMTEAGRMRIRALLNDYEQDINDGKAEDGKLDGWKAKAYMAEREAGIAPAMYSQYRIALEIANTDGNGNYSQTEAERAVRMLKGLSAAQKAYLFASTNSQWKKNPFGSATVSKYETEKTDENEKLGADEYLVEGSSLLETLTARDTLTEQTSGSGKARSRPKKIKKLDTLKVLKPLKNLF